MSTTMERPAAAPTGHTVEQHGVRWSVGSEPVARTLLKDNSHLIQAGFNAEALSKAVMDRVPILYGGGDEHRRQRAQVARYFAPKVIDERYRTRMNAEADLIETMMLARGHVDLDPAALSYSMTVAAMVIGLEYSGIDGMAKRLESFFNSPRLADSSQWMQYRENYRGMARLARFWWMDVRPAIKAHRAGEIDDVMGHLVKDGYKDYEILIECITYAAAGMVTTREFIARSALVLLENPELLADYRTGDVERRYAVLHEILRLNPVVTRLSRRVASDFAMPTVEAAEAAVAGRRLRTGKVSSRAEAVAEAEEQARIAAGLAPETPDETAAALAEARSDTGRAGGCPVDHHALAAGQSIDIDTYAVNTDPITAGECPAEYRVGRALPTQVKADVLGFGDGAHRCPGAFLAIRETDVLLSRLLRHDLELVSEPEYGVDEMISSYKVRNVRLRVVRAADTTVAPAPPAPTSTPPARTSAK